MILKQKGLGRGLDALLGASEEAAPAKETLGNAAIEQLQPGKYQPRTRMDQQSLEELSASIRAQGLMQPILVRPVGAKRYEIIAGEMIRREDEPAGADALATNTETE